LSGTSIASSGICNHHFSSEHDVDVIATALPLETTPTPQPAQGADADAGRRIDALMAPFKQDLCAAVEQLVAVTVAEAEAAIESARASGQTEIDTARTALADEISRSERLTATLAERDRQLADLRAEAETVRLDAQAAAQETEAAHEQIVSGHQSRIRALQADLDGTRAEVLQLKQQLAAEVAERMRLAGAIRTVQEACASAASDLTASIVAAPVASSMHPDETLVATAPIDRALTLVVSSAPAPIDAPVQLMDYLTELFAQIEALYEDDQREHALVDVVDRLSANLRCARDTFLKRSNAEGVAGADIFDQQLSAMLNSVTTTAFSRHLAIAAYQITQSDDAFRRAEAS
jgi:hypothetical protein